MSCTRVLSFHNPLSTVVMQNGMVYLLVLLVVASIAFVLLTVAFVMRVRADGECPRMREYRVTLARLDREEKNEEPNAE